MSAVTLDPSQIAVFPVISDPSLGGNSGPGEVEGKTETEGGEESGTEAEEGEKQTGGGGEEFA